MKTGAIIMRGLLSLAAVVAALAACIAAGRLPAHANGTAMTNVTNHSHSAHHALVNSTIVRAPVRHAVNLTNWSDDLSHIPATTNINHETPADSDDAHPLDESSEADLDVEPAVSAWLCWFWLAKRTRC
jgi:hypothetical protein